MSVEPSRPEYKAIAAQLKKRAVRNLRQVHKPSSTYRHLFAEIRASSTGAKRSRQDPELELYYASNIRGNGYLLACYLEKWIGTEQATALYATVEPLHPRCQYLSSLRSDSTAALPSPAVPCRFPGRLRALLHRFVSGRVPLVTLPLRVLSMVRRSSLVNARRIPPPRPPASS